MSCFMEITTETMRLAMLQYILNLFSIPRMYLQKNLFTTLSIELFKFPTTNCNTYSLFILARLLEHKHVGLLKLNKRVTVPEYFWKAICDPKRKMRRSVVYTARNPTDSEKLGFLEINSVKMLKERFSEINLPEFGEVCNPNEIGDFLEEFLKENF